MLWLLCIIHAKPTQFEENARVQYTTSCHAVRTVKRQRANNFSQPSGLMKRKQVPVAFTGANRRPDEDIQ